MYEWKTIPSNPDYEVSVFADIRHKESGSWVDQYMGRAKFEEPKHLRVRLRKDGLPIAHSVMDLVYETFPHLIPKAEEPEQTPAAPPKPKKKVTRKSKKRPAGRAKPYVDDLGPEWASIPGFSRYKINRDGKLINRRSKDLVSLRHSRTGSPNYSLLDDHGVAKARHPERLLSMAFRDLRYSSTIRKSAVYTEQDDWVIIPNRTRYSIHANGIVRRAERHRVTIHEDEAGRQFVKLKTDGVKGFKNYYISDLVEEIFGIREAA